MTALFLCGDVMTGRGIDQILAHPGGPELAEPYVRDARDYVALAEQASGPIPVPVAPAYIWGDALETLEHAAPAVRIINLETSVTVSNDRWSAKDVNYRMHPRNLACLTAAGIHVCVLANNHVLDFGFAGLEETLETLAASGLKVAGAGHNAAEARSPAVIPLPRAGRLLVFAFGTRSSGSPAAWAAGDESPGVELLEDLSRRTADTIIRRTERLRSAGDLVIASIHWGGNWGYEVPRAQVDFARRLIDGGVDLVHGHSSHHPRPIEVYRGKLVLYGCGDFIDDYEGITGFERFRSNLVLMYLPRLEAGTGRLHGLEMAPFQIRRMRLHRAGAADAAWLRDTLRRVSREFGTVIEDGPDGMLRVG